MNPELRWLQDLRLNGSELNRGMVKRVQLIEALEALGPLLVLEVDDPAAIIQQAVDEQDAQLTATFGVDSERGRAIGERDRLTITFQILRCRRTAHGPERYRVLGLLTDALPLLERKQIFLSGVLPEDVLAAIAPVPVVQETYAAVPVGDFHCLYQRPIVPLQKYLQENGVQAHFRVNSNGVQWRLTDLTQTNIQQSVNGFTPPDIGEAYPVLKLQTLSNDYLSKQLHEKMPFHVDMLEGADPIEAPPEFRSVGNPLTRVKSTYSIRPRFDFQTLPSFKARAGDMVEVQTQVQIPPKRGVVMRSCWQESGTNAVQRLLIGDIVNHTGVLADGESRAY